MTSGGHNTTKNRNPSTKSNHKKQQRYGSPGPTGNSDEARANAAIAAQSRMQTQIKSKDQSPTKVTKQKKQMAKELDLIEQRQQEMDRMKQDRIKKGLSIH